MKKAALILSLGSLLIGALPISSQQVVASIRAGTPVEHAQLGVFDAIGVGNNRIVVALPGTMAPGETERVYQSYDTNGNTLVEGLGSIMKVSSSLAPYEGHVVVVEYVNQGEHFVAKRIDFSEAHAIRETRGSIVRVDPRSRDIVLRNAAGQQETMHLGMGPGAAIDSNSGLCAFSELRSGQQVTVYFGPEHQADLVRIG